MTKKSIREMTDELVKNRVLILTRQRKIESLLPAKEGSRYARNKNTHGGWVVPGIAAWTRAVNNAPGFSSDSYWSGSAPTPSTQYPLAVAEFLEKINDNGTWYQDQVKKIVNH